jgi:hypothetical protein
MRMRTTERFYPFLWSRPRVALAAVALCVALFAASAVARQADAPAKPKPYALIFGTVWDPEGHPLYGIKVKIRRADEKKIRWELYSNHTGEFAQRVPAGKADYIVLADTKGVKLDSGKKLKPSSEVTVHIDNDERSDIGLHLDWY